jgi:hypothetical protein
MSGLLFMLTLCFVMISPLAVAWFNGGYWWLFVLSPLAFVLMIIATACYIRKKEDKLTFMRNLSLSSALREAEETYLAGTGIQLSAGDYASWIEVSFANYIPDAADNELGDFERVRREPVRRDDYDGEHIVGQGSGRSRRSNNRSGNRSEERFNDRFTRAPMDDEFEREPRGSGRSRRPENDYIQSIKQERAEVMLDINRRSHRRQNYDAGMSGRSKSKKHLG